MLNNSIAVASFLQLFENKCIKYPGSLGQNTKFRLLSNTFFYFLFVSLSRTLFWGEPA